LNGEIEQNGLVGKRSNPANDHPLKASAVDDKFADGDRERVLARTEVEFTWGRCKGQTDAPSLAT
jgi:hypothetical protein